MRIACILFNEISHLFTAEFHQNSPSDPGSGRKNYNFLGQDVSLECMANILGVGKKRFLKARKGLIDLRYGTMGHRPSPKTHSIDRFLFDLHGSVAETLPTEHLSLIRTHITCCGSDFQQKVISGSCSVFMLRFIRPDAPQRVLKEKMPESGASLQVCCELQNSPAEGSDSDDEAFHHDLDDIVLPSEQLATDLTLVQEVEMDRELWLRLLACVVNNRSDIVSIMI